MQRQHNIESGAADRISTRCDHPTMRIDDLLCNREAEACSSMFAAARCIRAIEGREDCGPVNGTVGTDHGTGTLAFLTGSAIRGGRVITDWPGLSLKALHEGRDLKRTTDVRAVAKGIATDLFGVSAQVLARDVFQTQMQCDRSVA